MTQLDGTLSRPSYLVPVVAGLLVAGAIALGGVAWSLGLGTGTSDTPTGGAPAPVTRTDRAAIVGGIQSEYLAGVAADWYLVAPRTDRAAIVGGIQSEYLAGVAADWYVTAPAVDPGWLQSDYLRELARDW